MDSKKNPFGYNSSDTKTSKVYFKRDFLLVQNYKIYNTIYLENKEKLDQQRDKLSFKHTDESDKLVVDNNS